MAKWKCKYCDEIKGVVNGVCPNCGPTQTTPLDEEAKVEGGYYIAEAEKKANKAKLNGEPVKPKTKKLTI